MPRTYERRSRQRPTSKSGVSRRKLLMAGGGITATYGGLLAYGALSPKPSSATEIAATTKHTLLLLDTTDPYTVLQNRLIDQWVGQELREQVSYNDRLELFQLQDNGFPVSCLFNEVSPKRYDDISRTFGDPDRQEQLWRREFWLPFEQGVAEARETEKQSTSPLIEGLFELSRILRHSPAGQKQVWIVSDGLQYSGRAFSAYNETLYRDDATYWQSYPADFGGTDVKFLYLYRPDKAAFQTARHRDWLTHWFTRSGAGNVEIIQG